MLYITNSLNKVKSFIINKIFMENLYIGKVFGGKYRIEEKIGTGAFGAIYKCFIKRFINC